MEETTLQAIDKVTQYLDKIALKLGVSVDTIWPWFVKQQYIEAYYSLFVFGLSLSVLSLFSYITLTHWTNICKNGNDFFYYMIIAALIMTTTISLIVFITEFIDIFNPQYAALKDILRIIEQ
jgi:hypothetical protein